MMDSQNISAAQATALNFKYVPRPGLLKIALINFFLTLITLTIYRFWAKTNTRKHVWSCIQINGEPLEYTGTGGELFRGFLVVFGLIILPFSLLQKGFQLYLGDQHPAVIGLFFLFILFTYVMFGFALYKQRKYQLSRTLWRGIRGTMAGSAMTYSLTYFGSLLARYFSFGWATPAMNTTLQEQMIGDMRFGDAAFKFKGRAGPLYPTYALCWFLTLIALIAAVSFASYEAVTWFGTELSNAYDSFFNRPDNTEPPRRTLEIIGFVTLIIVAALLTFLVILPMLWAIYTAKEIRTFANYTRLYGAQFHLNATAPSMIWLAISNLLLFIFTLGIARPYVVQRSVRYVFDRLTLEGAIDIDRIQQSQAALPKRGEGLADAFELGAW